VGALEGALVRALEGEEELVDGLPLLLHGLLQ